MTDESTRELEQRLRVDLAEIAEAVPVAEGPKPSLAGGCGDRGRRGGDACRRADLAE